MAAVRAPLDIVFVEGWMLGFAGAGIHASRSRMAGPNRALAAYSDWHRFFDAFVVLRAKELTSIVDWRVQAEADAAARGRPALNPAAIEDYIRRFLPAYATYAGCRTNSPGRDADDLARSRSTRGAIHVEPMDPQQHGPSPRHRGWGGSYNRSTCPLRALASATDPVCGMRVVRRTRAADRTHAGRRITSVLPGCRTRFAADPEKYLKLAPEQRGMHPAPRRSPSRSLRTGHPAPSTSHRTRTQHPAPSTRTPHPAPSTRRGRIHLPDAPRGGADRTGHLSDLRNGARAAR